MGLGAADGFGEVVAAAFLLGAGVLEATCVMMHLLVSQPGCRYVKQALQTIRNKCI